MKNLTLLFTLLLLPSLIISQVIDIELFASGFNSPIGIKNAGDDRLFVVEQDGIIKIVNPDGSVNGTPYLNIDDRVINSGNERGLLGLAFHPNYLSNGYVFVNYINNSGNTVVSRFVANPPNGNTADPNTEVNLLTISQPYSNHNGGDMAFGSDGYLYIATGDGGSGGDPENRSQNLTTLLGKMLRIDVNNAQGGNNYAIPNDNPFVGNASALDEIWAYGLRNPWRFSFDSQTNDLWIADVGQFDIEEINSVAITEDGLNYGWRCYEGNSVYNNSGCPSMSTMTFPVAQYTHSSSGAFKCSITGGYVYRGSIYSNLTGKYLFADYCSDEIGVLSYNGSTWEMAFSQQFSGNGWTSFGEAFNGELYISGRDSGNIYHIIDSNLSIEEFNRNKIKLYPNPTESNLTVSVSTGEIKDVTIFDLQGKQIKSLTELSGKTINISTHDIARGIYMIKITNSNSNSITKKLVVN
ncbi:PQQ-dependent sugar dehydrogenase [Hanstruepera marina]|uniref:PQQ-dependent sugar dehydrogenase n=1 Tax=Hanstruepera marina TaxID=2873265 RepID=UPI001CA734A2|nr:PQQ-dependent sugar dehydrogenase [Hanstruepera marina]